MSERPSGRPSRARLPPGWTDLNASTPAGRLYVAAWRAFPDVTPFETGCAMAPPPDLGWLRAGEAVARVGALREARRERPDLTEDRWQRLVRRMWPHLTEAQRQDAPEILAELDLEAPAARERDPSRGGLDRQQVVAAVVEHAVRTSAGSWDLPTQAATAEALDLADARRIRQVQGPDRWAGIQADARRRLAEPRAD